MGYEKIQAIAKIEGVIRALGPDSQNEEVGATQGFIIDNLNDVIKFLRNDKSGS